MSCGIYKWTSPSGKSYIGQSINLEKRYYEFIHMEIYSNPYKKKGLTKIDKARKKYPDFKQWTYEILEYCNPNELNEKEQYYINLYNTFKNGYNETIGGKGCNGYKVSEEFKQLLSISRMGENNPMYGKTPSKETREKLSKAHKGRIVSEETKEKISNANKGRIVSEETRKKQSILHKGQVPWNKDMTFPKKQINQYALDGTFIKTWDSANDIDIGRKILTCHIYECCNGKRKTAYGFIWRYHN